MGDCHCPPPPPVSSRLTPSCEHLWLYLWLWEQARPAKRARTDGEVSGQISQLPCTVGRTLKFVDCLPEFPPGTQLHTSTAVILLKFIFTGFPFFPPICPFPWECGGILFPISGEQLSDRSLTLRSLPWACCWGNRTETSSPLLLRLSIH